MSTPDEAVQASLAAQAASVPGADSVPSLDMSAAAPAAADPGELLARLQALEAQQAAAHAAANPEPEPPDNTLRADSNAPGWLHDVIAKIDARLSALEN